MDLCSVLCNSLDNAIEACQRVEPDNDKNIVIDLSLSNQYIETNICNTMKEEKINSNLLETIKVDKEKHGIGMTSMKTVVKNMVVI